MKFAISNISLPPYTHHSWLEQLPRIGFHAIEIAPSRVWKDCWRGVSSADVSEYRNVLTNAGLGIVGLHSLLFDQRHLGLFKGKDIRDQTLGFFTHLSAICRDLGGRTLVWGGGRHRGSMAYSDARVETEDFFGTLAHRIASHGTCFCLEPLGPNDTDFIHSAHESLAIVEAVDSPSLAVQLDAKALVENDEASWMTVHAVRHRLVHFHANEPGLLPLGSSGSIDHKALGQYLRDNNYEGYVTAEQIFPADNDGLAAIFKAAEVLTVAYGSAVVHE